MTTHSTIALELPDGSIKKIYCHWYGSIEENGNVLYNFYSDYETIYDLINLGDLSILGEYIGVKHQVYNVINTDIRYKKWCSFYGRDHGEENCSASTFECFDDYKANHTYQEYEYIFRQDGQWYVSCQLSEYHLLSDHIEVTA